jgi:hypothetical protein
MKTKDIGSVSDFGFGFSFAGGGKASLLSSLFSIL